MSRINKFIRDKLQKQIDNSHTIVVKRIDNDPTLTAIKKRYLKRASHKLCKHEILVEHNRILDLRGMIEADLESRALRDVCRCAVGNIYCFCVDYKNKWIS